MRFKKGIILAAGKGTRLTPATKITVKPLLPLYDKPLLYYALSNLINAGVREVLFISQKQDIPQFKKLFSTGKQLGMKFSYSFQNKQIGIPDWMKEWGVGDPEQTAGGLAESGPRPQEATRQITLMQRKKQKLGRNLGKTTGWIHRSALKMKNVQMIGNLNYEEINKHGIMVSDGEIRENPRLLPADTIVICAGQESERSLADDLMERGKKVHIIGGADVASELDAKRAIDQGVRLAISL